MSFYFYILAYFLTGLLALWFFLFLLRNQKINDKLTLIMLTTSLVSVLWCVVDFLTVFAFFAEQVQIFFWRASFFFSWTLTLSFFLFIVFFLRVKLQKIFFYFLAFIYLLASYFLLFTDKVIFGLKPLDFAGASNYIAGKYLIFLVFFFVLFLALIFYFILQHYLGISDQNEKKSLRNLVSAISVLFILVFLSNLLLPILQIQFPRLAVVGIALIILAIWQAIYQGKIFAFIGNTLKIKTKLIFLFIFLAFVPLLLVSYLFFNRTENNLKANLALGDEQSILFAQEKIMDFFKQAEKDTFFLSRIQSLQYLINNDDYEVNKQRLKQNFLALSENSDIYYQIRYIDENGQEIVRVDTDPNNSSHFIVTDEKLQNKKDRYYFTDTMALARGALYISPLDLNIENNAIEVPLRPVIRYATRVFDRDDNPKGIVILNVEAKHLLEDLQSVVDVNHQIYLVNKEGYFLLHPDKNKEWGKDLKKIDNKIQNELPTIAEQVLERRQNVAIFDEVSHQYFNTQRIYLYDEQHSIKHLVSAADDYIILLLSFKDEILKQNLNKTFIDLIQLGLVLLFVIFLLSLIFSKILANPLKRLAKNLELVSQNNLDHKMEINSRDEIGNIAQAFNQMLDWLKKSRQEVNQKVAEQTKDILSKNDILEKQEKAILNILDDTERGKKQIEALVKDLEKFKLAVENASDHIVITDNQGNILYANKAVEEISGFKISEILGKKAGSKELWGGLMDADFYKKMWDTIKNKKQVFQGKINNKRKNGQVYIALSSISPILNKNNEVDFFLGIERDITKEEEINQAKTEFVSLASHQLRTPLSAINWYTEMLLDGDAGQISEQQKQFLGEIYKGNQRMVDLVNALLNVSRIELGTLAVDPEPTNLADLADSVVNELQNQIKAKALKIIKNYSKDIPLLKADPKLLRILWQNLLSNAVKYTPANGKIEISLVKKAKDFFLSVSDNGYGIPKHQQDKIFTKLFRADNVRDKDTDGTGLGLYIVKAIVEAANGKIWLESEENKGTTFYISLPSSGMQKKEGSKDLNYTK